MIYIYIRDYNHYMHTSDTYIGAGRIGLLADLVCHEPKVVRPTAFFLNSKHLFVRQLVSWPTGQLSAIMMSGGNNPSFI